MQDIDAVLAEAAEQIEGIRAIYERTLGEQTVSAGLQAKIKNVVENQRSSLEYLADTIVQRYGRSGARAYYPLAKNAQEFSLTLNRNMPGVAKARPDIASAIEKQQPYHPDLDWLDHLVTLTNENKHRRLTPQTRAQQAHLRSGSSSGGFTGVPGGAGIMIGHGASIVIGDGARISFGGGPIQMQNVVQTIYIDWLFTDLKLSVIGTLERIQRSLPPLIGAITEVAQL